MQHARYNYNGEMLTRKEIANRQLLPTYVKEIKDSNKLWFALGALSSIGWDLVASVIDILF